MGLSLVGGVFNEDFDYGYPYDKIVADSAPEFEYSGRARTHHGWLTSTKYDRKHFTLHYQNHSLEPNNYDVGLHGGAHTSNYHYLLFPLLQWDQCQILTLKVHLSAAGTLSFDRSFDGYYKDHFYLVVNNYVRAHHDSSAGHGWTTTTHALGKGWNTIHWVLKTSPYDPPVVRGGDSKTSTRAPSLPRYFRLTSINITNVDLLKDGPHSRAKMIASGSLTATAHLDEYAKVDLLGRGYLYEGTASGAIFMTAQTSFLTDWNTERDMGQAILQGTSSLTVDAQVSQNHESDDGGLEIGTSGALTIKVPIDQPQTISDRTKLLTTTYFDYPTPVVVDGKLRMPTYRNTQTSTIATASSYTYNDPVNPSSVNHVLPVAETYRWVAVDVTGADDTYVTTWPERNAAGNPDWLSDFDYKPSVHPHDHFNEEGLNVITYARVVRTYWRTAQHMWINLGTYPTGPHYTWQFVGIFHPTYILRHNHILDNGLPTPDEGDNLGRTEDIHITEDVGGARSGFGLYPKGVQLFDNTAGYTRYKRGPVVTKRPQVITVVYGDNSVTGGTGVTVYQHGYRLNNRFNLNIPISTNPNFILGRWHGHVSPEWASHMSLMEVAFFNKALSSTEVTKNANYLMGVYLFNQYR